MFKKKQNETEEYTPASDPAPREDADLEPYEETALDEPEEPGRMSPKAKALLLFFSALAVLICSVGMCMGLLARSTRLEPLPVIRNVQPMRYKVNQAVPENPDKSDNFMPPESKYGSDLLNFLILSVDDDRAETYMLLSLSMSTKKMAILSFPRDTYIFGDYAQPALRSVYTTHAASGRGVQALREAIKNQINFDPDYYVVLNRRALDEIFEITGDIELEVPEYPNFSGLDAGVQTVGSWSAMKLLSCRSGYSYVETDSTRIQRQLLLSMLYALVTRCTQVEENMTALKNVMETDLTADNLSFLLYYLRDADFRDVPMDCLPGQVIEAEGEEFYQVEPQGACDLLNRCFNPFKEDLTVFNIAFRQLQGDATEGEWTNYRDAIVTTPTTQPSTKPTSGKPEDPEPTEPKPTETQAPTPPSMPDGPDAPQNDNP